MKSRYPSLVFLLLLALLPAGCGGSPSPAPSQNIAPQPKAETPVLDFLAANEQGASATLDDPAFGQGVHVVLDVRFFSATGEECKRAMLTTAEHEAEVVVACRRPDGAWRLAPRIWGQGLPR